MKLPALDLVRTEIASRDLHSFIKQSWQAIDPSPFMDNWHLGVISEHLEAVATGQIRNLLINIPPRHMKSIGACVAFPAWVWQRPHRSSLQGPQVRFLFSSYAQTLSTRDSVKCRRLIESAWYQDRWGERFQLTSDQNTKTRFENDQGGYRIATSVEGVATGDGGDIICIDDPHNANEVESETTREGVISWWRETMSTRLNDKQTGAYIVIMQRLNERDLAGHILVNNTDKEWVHLCLPARYERNHPFVYGPDPRTRDGEPLWKNRFPDSALKSLEKSLGSYAVAGQMQQRPAPREGGMIKRQWFQFVHAVPAGARRVRGWDFAGTDELQSDDPDYTSSARVSYDREGVFYLDDVTYQREQGLQVEISLRNIASQDGKKTEIYIPQDPAQAGKYQAVQFVRRLAGFLIHKVPYSGTSSGKTARASVWAVQAEAGNFKIVVPPGTDVLPEWVERFLESACNFPNARHDDDIDAVSMAVEGLLTKRPVHAVKPTTTELVSPFSE